MKNTIKGNEYLGFSTFFNQYERYKKIGDFCDNEGYLIEAECNYCFAAECLIKGILTDNGIRITRDHDLVINFNRLPEEYKDQIKNSTFNINQLEQHKLNFEKCRYFYDKPKEFRDGQTLSFDASLKYVKTFCDELYKIHLGLMVQCHFFSYDCFDEEGNSHDGDYTFAGQLNKSMLIYLTTYPNVEDAKNWIKIGYDKNQIKIIDSFDEVELKRKLQVTPLKTGKIQISVTLDNKKLKAINKNLDEDEEGFKYRLMNPIKMNIKVPRKKECFLKRFINKIFKH